MADQYDQATPNHNVGDAEKRAFHAFFRAEVARDVSPPQSGPATVAPVCLHRRARSEQPAPARSRLTGRCGRWGPSSWRWTA